MFPKKGGGGVEMLNTCIIDKKKNINPYRNIKLKIVKQIENEWMLFQLLQGSTFHGRLNKLWRRRSKGLQEYCIEIK